MKPIDKNLNESWYNNLIEDIKLQESTGIVATKHAIGKRILQDFEKFGKPQYGQKKVSNIAKDCGVSNTDIKGCITFARKYPTLDHAVDQLPWRKIRNELLVENPKEKVDSEDWFKQHTNSDIDAFTLKLMVNAQKRVEKDFGVIYLNEFADAIQRILELGVTHINYKEIWK